MLLEQLDLLLDKYTIASRALLERLATRSLLEYFWHVEKNRIGSPSDADQCRSSRPLPITHTDRARPVPDCLIGLDRVDRIGNGSLHRITERGINSFYRWILVWFPDSEAFQNVWTSDCQTTRRQFSLFVCESACWSVSHLDYCTQWF